MTVTSRPIPLTLSIDESAALFDMSPSSFTRNYIRSGRLSLNRLHQLHIKDVLALYDELQLGPYSRYKPVLV